MIPIHCLYCQKLLFQYYGTAYNKRKCDDCKVEYYLDNQWSKITSVFIKLDEEEYGYSVSIRLDPECFEICGPSIFHDPIVTLTFIPPHITLQNIRDKVKLYLTFL